jgi:tRNA (cytidine/uridine-2'-O-)-methyltransferase
VIGQAAGQTSEAILATVESVAGGVDHRLALCLPAAEMNDPDLPGGRLRAQDRRRTFHVVLLEPEIPPNTGNIARLCGATRAALHLVGKLGFSIDEHAVRRAGLDYWHLVEVRHHVDLEAAARCIAALGGPGDPANWWWFSGKATRSWYEAPVAPGDVLVFGKESAGLPDTLLERYSARVVGLPTLGEVRSLNLANSVSAALYEALRSTGALTVDTGRR